MDVLSGVLLVIGATFVLLGAIGMVRFGRTFERMHAASEASTLGLLALGAGAAIVADGRTAAALVLVVTLHLVTVPVGSHLIGRAAQRRQRE